MSEKIKSKSIKGIISIALAGMMITMLNNSIINIALPQIMDQFHIDASTAQWLSTGYMLVVGILVPVSAFLVQRFSYKQLFIAAMSFFTVGSIVCALSPSFNILMPGRILQALGGGILMPLSMNIFMAAFPVEKRGSAMGILGLGLILAPALGPTISGYFVQYYNWDIMFYIMFFISIIILVVASLFFKFEHKRIDVKLDIFGVILSTIGFSSLLYGVSNLSSKGFNNPEVYVFLIIAVIILTFFSFYQLKKYNPLLDLKIFKDFNFSYTLIVNIIIQIALYGAMILLPIYLQTVRGFSALDSGFLLMPGSLLMGILGVFTGKLFDKYGIRPLAIIGMAIMTVVSYAFSKLSMDISYTSLMLLYMARSFGMSFVVMTVSTAGLANIRRELIPHANALTNTLRQIASSIGTAVLVIIMSNQAKQYIKFICVSGSLDGDSSKLATLHGINTAFSVAMYISALALVMSFFFKKPKRMQEQKIQKDITLDS